MSKHFEIIRCFCEVLTETSTPFPGIYYRDGLGGLAEFETPSGIASYSCDSMEDFQMLCDTVTEDDGEDDQENFPDDYFDECGFDPYEGCYTDDC